MNCLWFQLPSFLERALPVTAAYSFQKGHSCSGFYCGLGKLKITLLQTFVNRSSHNLGYLSPTSGDMLLEFHRVVQILWKL